MTVDITHQEREFLLELLETKSIAMLHEMHHTDARDYKEMLKQRMELLEGLRAKLDSSPSPTRTD
jgi:recombinational DNA repair ATPase RecF